VTDFLENNKMKLTIEVFLMFQIFEVGFLRGFSQFHLIFSVHACMSVQSVILC
jgi:hypothetical protein